MSVSPLLVEISGGVGWLKLKSRETLARETQGGGDLVDLHAAVAVALEQLRWDDAVRVVVLTGERDGEFAIVPPRHFYDEPSRRERMKPANRLAARSDQGQQNRGARTAIETLVLMEKPVIARLNGDAFGFGQSLLFGCDIIVAREDAVVSDIHLGQGDVVDHSGDRRGFPWAVTPGDGVVAFLPYFMPPHQSQGIPVPIQGIYSQRASRNEYRQLRCAIGTSRCRTERHH